MEEQGSLAQKRRRTWAPVTSTSARCTLQLRASEWTYENILRCSIISTRKETYLKQNGNCQQPQGSRICDLQKSSTAILLFLLTCLDGFNDSRHGAIARVWQVAALNHIHKYRSGKWQSSLFWTRRTLPVYLKGMLHAVWVHAGFSVSCNYQPFQRAKYLIQSGAVAPKSNWTVTRHSGKLLLHSCFSLSRNYGKP